MAACIYGKLSIVNLMLKCKSLDIQVKIPQYEVNCFWLACYFGHGKVMKELANHGIDIYNTSVYKINALHLAIIKNHV